MESRVALAMPFLLSGLSVVLGEAIRRHIWISWMHGHLDGVTQVNPDNIEHLARRAVRRHDLVPGGLLVACGAIQLAVTVESVIAVGALVAYTLAVLGILGSRSEHQGNAFDEPKKFWRGDAALLVATVAGLVAAFVVPLPVPMSGSP